MLFALLFPLAWLNSELYSAAQRVARLKQAANTWNRSYYLAKARLAEAERLSAVEGKALELGMRYPEGIELDQDADSCSGIAGLEPDSSIALGVAPVAGVR